MASLHEPTGQSAPIFGLAHLHGIELMPRIRSWQDLHLFWPDADPRYKHIDGLFTGVIDWPLIEAHCSPGEGRTTRLWLEKMLARAEKGDVAGDYRRHWLLKDVLEVYFLLRGEWYFGPDKSLALLRDRNPAHFGVFQKAFAPGASMVDIRAAVVIANGRD